MQNTPSADDQIVTLFGLANQAPVFTHEQAYALATQTGVALDYARVQSLAQAADGSLYVSYVDDANQAAVIHQTGSGWESISLSALEGASKVTLATSADGVPYMLIQRLDSATAMWAAEVRTLQDGTWVQVGTGTIAIADVDTTALMIDAAGTPYLTYTDTSVYRFNVARFADDAWNTVSESDIAGLSGGRYDLSMTAEGTLYMAFQDSSQGGKATVMRLDGAEWTVVGAPGFSDIPPDQMHMAAGGGAVYVVYGQDSSGGDGMRAMQFNGSAWVSLPALPDVFQATAMPYELTVGDDGALYLIAKLGRSAPNFHVVRYADDAWTVLTDEAVPADSSTSVILGGNGHVYAAYIDSMQHTTVVQELEPAAEAAARTTGTAVDLGVTDADGDALTYTIEGGRDAALFELTDGGIRFVQQPTEAGTYQVRIAVDDGMTTVTRLVNVKVVVPPNATPVLDATASPQLPASELGVAPDGAVGVKVADLLGASVSDADGDAVGMAITGINGGTLHYSTDGGATWIKVTDVVSAEHALALKADTRIFFEADPAAPLGTVNDALDFRAWDGTDGANGVWLDLSGIAKVVEWRPSPGAIDVVSLDGLLYEVSSAGLTTYDPKHFDAVGVQPEFQLDAFSGIAAGNGFIAALGTNTVGENDYPALIVHTVATNYTYTLDHYALFPDPISLAAHGDTLLVGSAANGVQVFQLDREGYPSLVDDFAAATPTALALDDTRFIIGNGATGLMLVDRVSGLASNVDLAPFYVETSNVVVRDLALQGQYLFIATAGGGLVILDVSDMAEPTLAAQVPLAGLSEHLIVVEDRVFVATSGAVQVVDVSDIHDPQVGTPIAISQGAAITQVGDRILVATDDRLTLISTGALPDSVSADTDTVSVDVQDTVAPVVTLPGDAAAHLRGVELIVQSTEGGKVYLVKAGTHTGTPTAEQLDTLAQAGTAPHANVVAGAATFDTDALLGEYVVYAVDGAGNVSNATGKTVTIRTVPELTVPVTPLQFTEGDGPLAIATALTLADDDAADTGLAVAYVRLVADSPILIGGAPIMDIQAGESLSLTIDPATMAGLSAVYAAEEGLLTITGTAGLAAWEAALKAVRYANTSHTPVSGRIIEVSVLDTDLESFTQKNIVVEITAVDDAPTITGVPAQSQTVEVGAVTNFAPITVADADSDTLTVTLTATNGSIGGIATVDGHYVLTGTAAQINAWLAQATFTLATAGTGGVSISVSDGSDADPVVATYGFSTYVNHAPVLDATKSPALPIAEAGAAAPQGAVGTRVGELIGAGVSDADDDEVGMAITSVKGGTLYYSTDDGATWAEVTETVDAAHALALSADARVYFRADPDWTGTLDDALTFRAWDGTDGQTGDRLSLGVSEVLSSVPLIMPMGVAAAGNYVLTAGIMSMTVLDSTTGTVVDTLAAPMVNLVGVAVLGNLVYGLSQGVGAPYLAVASIATPTDVVNVGSTFALSSHLGQGPVRDIAALGNTVLVAGNAEVLIVATDTTGAMNVSRTIPVDLATAVALDASHIVIGNGDQGIVVTDREGYGAVNLPFPPGAPMLAFDVAIRGDYAFVASHTGGLLIAEIAGLDAPRWVDQVDFPSPATKLAVLGNDVYVVTQDSIQVVDVTDVHAPKLGTPIAVSGANGIAIVGDKLAVSTGGDVKLISSGALPDSVSADSDTVAVDIRDTTAPELTLPADADAHLRGETLTIGSSEDGKVYLVKIDGTAGTPTASQLEQLADAGTALRLTVTDGTATSPTDDLVGAYAVYAVDAAGNVSVSQTLTVVALPALQLSDTLSPLPLDYVENGNPITVAPLLTLSDADSNTVSKVAVTIAPLAFGRLPTPTAGNDEVLAFTPSTATGDIVSSFADGTLTLTSPSGTASIAQWQAALRTVTYQNFSDDPVFGRSIRFTVYDAVLDASTVKARAINIEAVNDAPEFSGLPTDTQIVEVGVAAALRDIVVIDPDSDTLTLTLASTNGTIGGLEDADPTTEGIQLTGSAESLTNALAGATFTIAATGAASIVFTLSDGIAEPVKWTYELSTYVAPPVTPPGTPTTPVDGVPVQIGTGSDGQQQIVVPVVTDSREDDPSTPNSKLADITLVKASGGTALLNVGVPVGTGLTANGPGTPVSGSTAQTVLATRIEAVSGSTQQKAAATDFLAAVGSGTQVVVQTVTLTAQADGTALVISAANTGDGHKTALVIDTRGLPGGTKIDLENVDFAIIVGDARVTGGAGANIAYGDDENQFIVLGEGDDILHGAGGNDTVGSLRGNDQTFGDDGNDVVYGGTGNDVLHGGAGNDRMNGGFGLDQAVQSGVLTDYTVTVDGHTVVLTHNTTGEVDRFLDVEAITFDSGTSLIVAHEAGDVATLTAQFSDAQLIELNANRAVTGSDANDEVTPELGMALNIDLGAGQDIVRLGGSRADVHIDVEAGQRAELTRLADGAMLAFNNVEMLAFESGDVTVLAHNHEEAVIGRAYELLLGRNVDTDGYTFWLQGIEHGADLHTTLTAMMQSPEFTGASMSNADFVELLYVTGFDRASDPDGKAFWVNALDNGVSRAQIVETFAASDEGVTAIGSTIDVTVVS